MDNKTEGFTHVQTEAGDNLAIIYAGDYLNKLSGERIEREAQEKFDAGCRALIVSFKDTQLVNSIGISILMGILDAAEKAGARLVFSDLNAQTIQLFDMLGLSRHIPIAETEQRAIASFQNTVSTFA